MLKTAYSFLLFILSFIVCLQIVKADYITLVQADKCDTIIEIHIQEGSLRIIYEIGEKDYQWFKHIIPAKYYEGGFQESNQQEYLRNFFKNDFPVIVNGRPLTGDVTRLEKTKRIPRASLYTGKVDTTSKASKYVVFVEIVYPLPGKPAKISITPPLAEGFSSTLANIGFVTYHKKIPVHDIRYLGSEEIIHLDWKDPWYTRFENKNIRRHHNSSLMSFLYVEPYEVRHEILARVKDLESWIDLPYRLDDVINVEDQAAVKNTVANFLKGRNKVAIDGEYVEPIIDRVHFVEVNSYGIQIVGDDTDRAYASAIIGVIFAYPHKSLPQKVTIDWDLFSQQITQVPNIATDPAGPMKYFLSPEDSILIWQNFLKKYRLPTISEIEVTNASLNIPFISLFLLIPAIVLFSKNGKRIGSWTKKKKGILAFCILLAIVCFPLHSNVKIPFISKKTFSKPEAQQLIGELLKNTYRAFDFRKESDIYDKLAISNEGELLSEIYLQTKKSIVIENQGGIQAKIKEVDIIEVKEVDTETENLAYECRWKVSGTVGHWGHQHNRTNQYHAILNVKPVDGVWKLHGLDIIEEVRL